MAKTEKVDGLKARIVEQASELPEPEKAATLPNLSTHTEVLEVIQPQISQLEQALEMIGDKVGQLEGIIEQMKPYLSEEALPKSIVEGVTHKDVYLTALGSIITAMGQVKPIQQMVRQPHHMKNDAQAALQFAEEFTKTWLLRCGEAPAATS